MALQRTRGLSAAQILWFAGRRSAVQDLRGGRSPLNAVAFGGTRRSRVIQGLLLALAGAVGLARSGYANQPKAIPSGELDGVGGTEIDQRPLRRRPDEGVRTEDDHGRESDSREGRQREDEVGHGLDDEADAHDVAEREAAFQPPVRQRADDPADRDRRAGLRPVRHVEGDRRFTGTLTEATDTHITVGDPPRTLAYDDIEKAKTVFEWGPTPKPNAAPKTPKKKTKKATAP